MNGFMEEIPKGARWRGGDDRRCDRGEGSLLSLCFGSEAKESCHSEATIHIFKLLECVCASGREAGADLRLPERKKERFRQHNLRTLKGSP